MPKDAVQEIDAALMNVAAPETPSAKLIQWPDPLKRGCLEFGISGVRPVAALLAQGAHESGGFTHLVENLNYSAQGLANTWPGRFAVVPKAAIKKPNNLALSIARKPELIANNVYANRLGNGSVASGDGWRRRGAGLFQLTGVANQDEFGHAIGMASADVPAYLLTVEGAARSACWFFMRHGLIDLAKTPGIQDETKAINGGLIGLPDRTHRFNCVIDELIKRGC